LFYISIANIVEAYIIAYFFGPPCILTSQLVRLFVRLRSEFFGPPCILTSQLVRLFVRLRVWVS